MRWVVVLHCVADQTRDDANVSSRSPETIIARRNGALSVPGVFSIRSVRQTVHEVVDAQLVRFVGLIDGTKSLARPFPELRDVGVVVDDDLEPLALIVVLVHTTKGR